MGQKMPKFYQVLQMLSYLAVLGAVILAGLAILGISGGIRFILLAAAVLLGTLGIASLAVMYAASGVQKIQGLPILGKAVSKIVQYFLAENEVGYYNQELVSEVLKTQAQIATLQSQINPHFLYNTLESIRSKALLHDEDEIATMIETLALLFRYNISRGDEAASIADELQNVKNYIAIQNYRFRNKFLLKLDLEDETEDIFESYMLPPLTLQPIVENAVHHGLEKKIGQGTICIRAFQTQDKLIIQVRDDGAGISAETIDEIREKLRSASGIPKRTQVPKKGSGIALLNVNQRIQLFFGAQYGLDIISAPNVGTQVELTLPAPEKPKGDNNANRIAVHL